MRRHTRTLRLGLVPVLCAVALAGTIAAGAAAPAAEAKGRCKPVAYIYPHKKFFYAIGGGRCTSKQHKMAVSGYLWGPSDSHFYEFSKECFGVTRCLELTPDLSNPRGRHRWKIAIVFGWKHHWYTMPHYRGSKKSYWF